MATRGLQQALDRIRIILAPDLPDEHLLRAFIDARDETAFATLVRRHGQMVLGVSRRILGNVQDSEDVLPATFLVLAQKARSVADREALGSWLYKVAYRIALKAKARIDRRRGKETQVAVMPHPCTVAPHVSDWEVFLDEELTRLPTKYRLPIILCDLEGRTRKEVERRLSLAEGTLSSRLTTARRMLVERLTRRGFVLSAGVVAASLSQAKASLPPSVAAVTAHNAVLVAAGQVAAVSNSVIILMKAGVNAMFIAKLKTMVATVLVLAVVATGGLVYSGGSQPKPESEVEALRHENELLKINLRVTLEKIKALESEVASLQGKSKVQALRHTQKATADELPTVFYQDFRKAPALADGLKNRNLEIPGHLQFSPEGLQIRVQKPHQIPPGRGLGVQTTFGLRGDFDITATFENFKADTPYSGPGVGLGLCISSMEKGEGVQIARIVRAKDHGILWSGRDGTAGGRLSPCNENAARFRFKRIGPTLYSMWAPGIKGDDYQILNQSELGTNDIRSVWVNVFTGGQALDVEGRLLELRIRGQAEINPVFDPSKSPSKGPPD